MKKIKHVLRPAYINYVYFGKRLVAIHEKKELLTLNKPIYVGCTVLELRELEIKKFHYEFMKDKVDIFSLILTDTDSFVYEINKKFYDIMHQHQECFDLSSYHKTVNIFALTIKKYLEK